MGRTKDRLRKRRRQEFKRRCILVAFPVAVALLIIYIVGVIYFTNHFCGRDTVFGIKVARQTSQELMEQVVDKIQDYQLLIETRTGVEVIGAKDVALDFSDKAMIEKLLKDQRQFFWFTQVLGKSEDIPIRMEYDKELMEAIITGLECMDVDAMMPPVDAHLEFVDGAFVIVKEDLGTTLEVAAAKERILEAVVNGETVLSLEEAGCYQNPVIYQDHHDLERLSKEVNKLTDVTIVYDFKDRSEIVDGKRIASFIAFGEDFSCELSLERIEDYMRELGMTYDTFGLSRSFLTSTGRTVSLKGGDYGWLIDKESSAKELHELILAGKSVTTEPVYRYKGIERATNDIGDTYIEVSIARQWMWCYVDGTCIVDTPVVTGTKGVSDRETPKDGVWAIDAKMTDYYLVGEDYNSHVDYWLPFNGNVGIHDADWREMEEFGGATYLTDGSHGCVNTPYHAVKKIYENVIIGTPVVVY